MKRTALKRSSKQMAPGGLPAPTKAQSMLMEKLTDQVGCAVCLFFCRNEDGSRCEGSQGSIHHIMDGQRRISHWHIIPLCHKHHQAGTDGHPSRHSDRGDDGGLAEFEAAYATEMELVIMCEEYINQFYLTGLLTDEQAPQGECGNSDTTTDDKRTDRNREEKPIPLCSVETFSRPVRARVVHYRYRLADVDGLNAKAAIDGIVKAGLLQNDSPKFVQAPIIHDQVKVSSYEEEKTVVTLEEIS